MKSESSDIGLELTPIGTDGSIASAVSGLVSGCWVAMQRLVLILPLAVLVLTGCASLPPAPKSQAYWELHQATDYYHDKPLNIVYSQAFIHGFLDELNYRSGTVCLYSSEDEAAVEEDGVYLQGYNEGMMAAMHKRQD